MEEEVGGEGLHSLANLAASLKSGNIVAFLAFMLYRYVWEIEEEARGRRPEVGCLEDMK